MRNRTYFHHPLSGAMVVAVALSGCSKSEVAVPTTEKYPPQKAAEIALQTYDANNDGKISGEELDKSLALKYSMSRVDRDGDKAVSGDEIADRIRAYENQSTLSAVTFQLVSRRGPVSDATAVMELEPFMGPDPATYTVTTDESGTGIPKLPDSDSMVVAIPIGFYRVTISTPDGGEIVRGCEVADDAPTANRIIFSLEHEGPQGGGGR